MVIFSLFHFLKAHGDAASGTVLGASTSAVVATAPPHPELWVEALRWVAAACVSMLPIVVTRVLAYRQAKAARLGQLARGRALVLRSDNNPNNDAQADALDAKADEHEADAAGVAAASNTNEKRPP